MPENQNIEWKSKWRDDYLEWICGFANAQGGRIYIGCDDNGHIIGLDNTRKLLEDIPNKVRNAMSIVVDVNRLEEDGKEYIEIVVPPYPVAISCKGRLDGKTPPDQCWPLYKCSHALVQQRSRQVAVWLIHQDWIF